LTDDSWSRNSGATFLIGPNGTRAGVDWMFRGYGNKFPFSNDRHIAQRMFLLSRVPRFSASFEMEGGAFDVDANRTLVTTRQTVLHPNRHPDGMIFDQRIIAERFADYLGIKKAIFLPNGLPDDSDTDGHVDNVARWAEDSGVIFALSENSPADSNYAALEENLDVLARCRDALGQTLRIVKIPQPPRRDGPDGRRLSLSYLNFYPVNRAIICPAFDSPEHDRHAETILRSHFPHRAIIMVPSLPIVRGGGGIHCITQQEPVP
jgi:agmatine deiminase